MSFHAEPINDWECPHPFRALRLESEHEAELGQWRVQVVLLGIGAEFTWVYDADTPLRTELAEMMDDPDLMENARVWVPYREWEATQADADKWRESQR